MKFLIAKMRQKCECNVEHLKLDGVANIVRSPYALVSVVWSLVVLASACICGWLIVKTCQEYSLNQVSTLTRLVTENQAVFPTVVLCSKNPLTTEYALEVMNASGVQNLVGEPDANFKIYNHILDYMYATKGRYLNYEEQRAMSDLDTMLITCEFQGRACNASDFEFYFHPFYLNCYRFNSDGKRTVSMAGERSELKLELYAGLPNAIRSTFYRGFWLFIRNSSEYSRIDSPSPYEVTPGFGTSFMIDRVFFNQLEKPFSDCTVLANNKLSEPLLNPVLFEQVASTGYDYTRETCTSYCFQYNLVNMCNCSDYAVVFNTTLTNFDYCLNEKDIACLFNFYADRFMSADYIRDKCLPLCPLECSQRILRATISQYKYPHSDAYAYEARDKLLRRHPQLAAHDDLNHTASLVRNLVELAVYYDKFTYTQIVEERKMTWMDLIGIVGGHLHLFLGMSVFSFCQLVALMLYCCSAGVVRSRNNSSKTKHRKQTQNNISTF